MSKKVKEFRTPHQIMIRRYQPARLDAYAKELRGRIEEEETGAIHNGVRRLVIANLKTRLRDVVERQEELSNG